MIYGLQCPLQLWLRANEPDAVELELNKVTQALLDTGIRVGEIARDYIPGGVLIEGDRYQQQLKLELTEAALNDGYELLYEAAFCENQVFVAVDILSREEAGWVITEVKSGSSVKDEYLSDVAIQLMTLEAAGLNIFRAEVMHLNRACTHPDLTDLFVRSDVTSLVRPLIPPLLEKSRELNDLISAEQPDIPVGDHCKKPHECPFIDRCWPTLPEHYIGTLYSIRQKKLNDFLSSGIDTVDKVPSDKKLSAIAARQVSSVSSNKIIVEPGLKAEIDKIRCPIAFLDFETIRPAIPVWNGCHPYDQIPVQFSCHLVDELGDVTHYEWLATHGEDPRPGISKALVEACSTADTVVAYNMGFERKCLELLADAQPECASALSEIAEKLYDLLPVVRNYVYHPKFRGSFSIKSVIPALAPELAYEGLEVASGDLASLELERLILGQPSEQDAVIKTQLLSYCERDTFALVRLYQLLGEKAFGVV